MSITKGFEKRTLSDEYDRPVTSEPAVMELLVHARALEAILKEVEWFEHSDEFGLTVVSKECPWCGNDSEIGHTTYCQLAKILDGVE